MRKPELFKMACLRDIQRLFASRANEAFYAGFGNRITDAMSYRSVGVPTSKIYTIDSTGVVKTELLQAAGHKGSYVGLVRCAARTRADDRMTSSTKYSHRSNPRSSLNTPTSTTGDLISSISLFPTSRPRRPPSLLDPTRLVTACWARSSAAALPNNHYSRRRNRVRDPAVH